MTALCGGKILHKAQVEKIVYIFFFCLVCLLAMCFLSPT